MDRARGDDGGRGGSSTLPTLPRRGQKEKKKPASEAELGFFSYVQMAGAIGRQMESVSFPRPLEVLAAPAETTSK